MNTRNITRPRPPRRALRAALSSFAMLLLFVETACILGCSSPWASTKQDGLEELQQAHVVRVSDGDTLVVRIGTDKQKVRLIGVNTPESATGDAARDCVEGEEAAAYVKRILPAGTTVWLQKDSSETDKYSRLLRYVWLAQPRDATDENEVAAKMLNARLVIGGWAEAVEYEPDTSYAQLFERYERAASSPFSSGRKAAEAAR